MSELGKSVVEAVTFLRSFFGDVSKLVTVVEGEMTGAGLVSPWASNSIWGFSYSYTSASRWLPSYVSRQYVQAPAEGVKLGRTAAWYAFFVVHFAPHPLEEPTAVWGVVTLNGTQDVFPSFDKLLLTARGPKFLSQLPVDQWCTLAEPSLPGASLTYQARAVVDLRDETTVQQVVVQPLLELVEQVRSRGQVA